MFNSRTYRPEDEDSVQAFVRSQPSATLIAAGAGEHPQASILPFILLGEDMVELHAVRADPTFRALETNPRATLLVSDFLAYTPHEWIDAEDQSESTLQFQAVLLHGLATLSTDVQDVTDALTRLTDQYGRGPLARPISVDDELYAQQLLRLGVVRIAITDRQAKFKSGKGSAEQRRDLATHLRARNGPNDQRAASVIESIADGMDRSSTELPPDA